LLQGASALAYTLVEENLEYAIGTGNAAILLTLGKAIAMLNDMEMERRQERGTIEMVPGARKSPAMLRQEVKDLLNTRAAINMLSTVRTLSLLFKACLISKLAWNRLVQYGFRELRYPIQFLCGVVAKYGIQAALVLRVLRLQILVHVQPVINFFDMFRKWL
jgi:hypothetical protein